MNQTPLKIVGQSPVRISDVGEAKDAYALQYNIVRVNGQRSVYLPVLKQGGDSNTIQVVTGTREAIKHLLDIPPTLQSHVVFDQSQFVKTAISTLLHEGGMGLFLTGLMILIFLGSARATVAVFFSIPLSVLATFIVLQFAGSSVNSMMLGGLALALSRLIDNSVVVLENIYRHLEAGEPPHVAAEKGGREVALPVLAGTLATAVVFFPVTLLYGVSKYLFSAMALAVVISLAASYLVAMTVVPLFCALFIRAASHHTANDHASEEATVKHSGFAERFNSWFSGKFEQFLNVYDSLVARVLAQPRRVLLAFLAIFVLSLFLYPFLGFAFFPQTDAGQFVINVKAPSGTKLTETEKEIANLEQLIRRTVSPDDLDMIVSNIGLDPGFSAVYSPNAAMHTSFVQISLKPGHKVSSFEYIARVRHQMGEDMPELVAFFSSGSLVDSVVNLGMTAPIDIQITGSNLKDDFQSGQNLAAQIRNLKGASEVYIPQDIDYPALRLDIDRMHANELGLSEKEVVTNVITALTSNQMVAPNIWTDPKNGNNYYLTVQYPEQQIRTLEDLRSIPLHGIGAVKPTRLDMVAKISRFDAPTEVDHYQIRRKIDIYVRPSSEDLGHLAKEIDKIVQQTSLANGVKATVRGSVEAMNASFRSFASGLILSIGLLYLILVAQFRSFKDPFIILLALPPGFVGVMLTLTTTGTTLNVMSLMGLVMLAGIATSDSILIVEFAHRLMDEGAPVREAVAKACRVRLRPILMTSLATVIGLLPMALKFGEGSESYAPLARALVGGLAVSALLTVFIVPAGFYLAYAAKEPKTS
jgi:multidrug efflux pump subunit AcrB